MPHETVRYGFVPRNVTVPMEPPMPNCSMHHREPKSEIDDTGQFLRAYFGYLDPRVTFCLLARLAGTPKLGLAPLPNPLRVGHTTIIVG